MPPNSDNTYIIELRNTEKRLPVAASQITEDERFNKIRIDKVVKQAKCDKALIYRHFGELEDILSTWAKENDFYTLAHRAYSEGVSEVESSEDAIELI